MTSTTTEHFIIGDVHGCFDELMELVARQEKMNGKASEILMVGDLINKGPKSFEVLEWVRANNIPSVVGNHELKFLESCKKGLELSPPLAELKKRMGKGLDDWLAWLDQLPSFIEREEFIVVHAGVVPGQPLSKCKRSLLANIRRWDPKKGALTQSREAPPWYEFYRGKKLIVYGHWAVQGLVVRENSIGLDTGCVYGKKLTGLCLPSRKHVQVDAKRAYQKID